VHIDDVGVGFNLSPVSMFLTFCCFLIENESEEASFQEAWSIHFNQRETSIEVQR
jgi:hypothetical protein